MFKNNKINIIAEIGWNHMGNMKLAEKMIKAASKSGADFAKFQTWQVKNLTHGPWDNDGRREIYKKAELSKQQYFILNRICKKYKIRFLTSLFNEQDYELIHNLKLDTIKIPSPENRNKKLLNFCSKKFKNIFLSTGAANISEITKSYNLIKKRNIHLMHCVSMYPCDDIYVDLDRLIKLSKISNKINIGLSDHSPDILSAQLSLSMGVKLIEKHFTIDNSLPGRDNKFAILPDDLSKLKQSVIRYEKMKKRKGKFTNQEIEIRKVYTGRWTAV